MKLPSCVNLVGYVAAVFEFETEHNLPPGPYPRMPLCSEELTGHVVKLEILSGAADYEEGRLGLACSPVSEPIA